MQSSSSASTHNEPLHHSASSYPLSYHDRFTLAAAYLASLQPPTQPSVLTDERPALPGTPDSYPQPASASSLFDSHVHSCLAAFHSSTFVPAPPQRWQSAGPAYQLTNQCESYTAAPMKREEAAESRDQSCFYQPYQRMEPSSQLGVQQPQQLADIASLCAATLPSDAASSTVSSVTNVVSLSMQTQPSMERFSVSPSHYPLTRLDSASHCSTDSSSSYQSSLSSVQSPHSPTQPTSVPRSRDPRSSSSSSSTGYQADTGQYGSLCASPLAVALTAPQPSPVPVNGSEPSATSLRLPSFIYPTVHEALSAALQAAAADGGSTVSAAAEKRKGGGVLDTERRLKHRAIDANRRRREMLLVERFATLSGQRNEPLSRDRVTTLEVACDRYEELIRAGEAMRVKMRLMEERLQALGTSAVVGEQPHSKRKAAAGRRTVRQRTDGQADQFKRQPMQNCPLPSMAGESDCNTALSNATTASHSEAAVCASNG